MSIEHKPVADVTFEVPGIYGFKCKVHGRHVMYAPVVVGSPDTSIDGLEFTQVDDLGRRAFEGLFEKMRKDMLVRKE